MHNFRHMSREKRQWIFWGVHMLLYFGYLGWLVASETPPFAPLSKGIAVVWLGLLALHAMWIGFSQPDNASAAEKAKRGERLALSDDGELVDIDEYEDEGKVKRDYGQ
jgi:hypothetical protein